MGIWAHQHLGLSENRDYLRTSPSNSKSWSIPYHSAGWKEWKKLFCWLKILMLYILKSSFNCLTRNMRLFKTMKWHETNGVNSWATHSMLPALWSRDAVLVMYPISLISRGQEALGQASCDRWLSGSPFKISSYLSLEPCRLSCLSIHVDSFLNHLEMAGENCMWHTTACCVSTLCNDCFPPHINDLRSVRLRAIF